MMDYICARPKIGKFKSAALEQKISMAYSKSFFIILVEVRHKLGNSAQCIRR